MSASACVSSVEASDWDGFVEAAGTRFHVRRRGVRADLPAVVLEAGGGGISTHWARVEAALAKQTLVFSYDRAGMGFSSPAAKDVGVAAASERLERLVQVLEPSPAPYILVGHSMGGLYARYAAALRRPGLVGIVLLDATPSAEVPFPGLQRRLLKILPALVTLLARTGLLKALERLDEKKPGRERPAGAPAASDLPLTHYRTSEREIARLEAARRALLDHPTPPETPVLAITAGFENHKKGGDYGRFRVAFTEHQAEMARRARQGRHVLIDEATHMSVLLDKNHAEQVAAEIIEFATCLKAG